MSAPSSPPVLTVHYVSEDLTVNIGDESFLIGDSPRDVFTKLRKSSDTRSYERDHDEDAVEIRLPRYGISFYFDPFLHRLQAIVCQTLDTVRILWNGKVLHPYMCGLAATVSDVGFVVMGSRDMPWQWMKGSEPPYFTFVRSCFAFDSGRRETLSPAGSSNRESQQHSSISSADESEEGSRRSTESEVGSAALHTQQAAGGLHGQAPGGPVPATGNGSGNSHDNPSASGTAAGNSENDCDALREIDQIVFNKGGERRATVSVGSVLHPHVEEEDSDEGETEDNEFDEQMDNSDLGEEGESITVSEGGNWHPNEEEEDSHEEDTEGEEKEPEKTLSKVVLFDDHLYDELRVSTKTKFFLIRYDQLGKRYLQMMPADLTLEEGALANSSRLTVHFEENPLEVLRVLGQDCDLTTPELSPDESNELVKYRFFRHGIDVVFRQIKDKPLTRKVVQFILHTCHPQHADFLTHSRCLFSVDLPSRVVMRTEVEAISTFSKEDDIRKMATIQAETSDEHSRLYGGEGLTFKVMNGLLATVTVEEDKDVSKVLDPIRPPEIPEWSALRNAENFPIFRLPLQ